MIETNELGLTLALAASLALAGQNVLVSKGTDEGRAYDAVLIVMLTNVVVLSAPILAYYHPDYGLSVQSVLSYVAAGLVGTLVGRAMKYVSIKRIGAGRTAPITQLQGFVAVILGLAFLGERLTTIQLLAIATIVGGVAFISRETAQENPRQLSRRELLLGLAFAVGSAVAYGIEPIFAVEGANAGTPIAVGAVIKTSAATVGFFSYLRFAGMAPSVDQIWRGNTHYFVLAGVANSIFTLCFYLALGLAPVSLVVPLLPTSTLFTIVIAYYTLPRRLEQITLRLFGASLVVVLGVVVLAITR